MIHANIASPQVTQHILKAFGLRLNKKLGQNFLIDPQMVEKMVEAGAIGAGDTVLEIGPGIGTLTQGLAETGARVVAVEIDAKLLPVLAKTLAGYENVRVIHQDILKLDIRQEVQSESFKVAANLPYYITTPILMELLEQRLPLELLITMVQKEVALRMVAKPGGKDYGALSLAVQYFTKPELVCIVPPRSFLPPPAVESAIICCRRREKPPVELLDEKMFFRTVKVGFAQRRKTFANSLKAAGVDKEKVALILETAEIDGGRRGETFSLQEFADIANAWVRSGWNK